MPPPKISLSLYLLKPGAHEPVKQLFDDRRATTLAGGLDGRFINFPAQSKEPTWFQVVSTYLPAGTSYIVRGQAPAGMIVLFRNKRQFVITFGHAWQYLEIPWLEADFGRTVALSTIPPDKVLEINAEQVFAKNHSAKERAPSARSIREFGVESDRDLVGAIEGEPSDPTFGNVIRGATSLRLKIPMNSISSVLDKSLALFASTGYKKKYPDIDNLIAVNDVNLIATLDQILDQELVSGKAKNNAVLFAPSFRRGDAPHADSFAFGRRGGNLPLAPYLTYSGWERHLQSKGLAPSLHEAKSTTVHMLDTAEEIFETRYVYDCLGYEVSNGGKQYVLSSSVWYAADAKFVTTIEATINNVVTSTFPLPKWNGSDREDEYNDKCCTKNNGFLHFDKSIIHFGGGQSKFEFCDFMDPKKRVLFFAKIPSKSAGCSHLVEQVNRTVELLYSPDNEFRIKLKSAIQKKYPRTSTAWLDTRPKPGDWTMCLVSLGRAKNKLPLFAKCSIAKLAKALDRAGHPVLFAAV